MEFLSFVASLTRKRPLVSRLLANVRDIPAFGETDVVRGRIAVVIETGDPTDPTSPADIQGSTGIGLTDGISVVYAPAIILSVENGNEVNFKMVVDSQPLRDALALTTDDYIPAFFEARIQKDDQEELLLREAVIITKAASPGGATIVFPLSFLELTDTPDSYSGFAGFAVVVNASENALTFVPQGTGGGGNIGIYGETPNGAIDGLNRNYYTNNNYMAGTLSIFLNGLRQRTAADYAVLGQNGFQMNLAPFMGDTLSVDYIPQ